MYPRILRHFNPGKEMAMSLMCNLDGCKQKPGMCIHEKMMLGTIIMIGLIGGLAFYFR